MEVGLIGGKLGHSISPKIHKAFFNITGIDGNYNLYEIERSKVKDFLHSSKENGFTGFNVTIPYKVDVLDYLSEISPEAFKIGAANTILLKGGLKGFNTDYFGIHKTFLKYKISIPGQKALILGGGGAARAVVTYLKDHGILHLVMAVRNIEKASREFDGVELISLDSVITCEDFDIVINTTPLGMYPNITESPLSKEQLSGADFVFDMIYNPPKTKLLQFCDNLKIPHVNGLYMLIGQAVKAQEIWNNKEFGEEIIDKILRILTSENIVLTGIMGCGKTTIGMALAQKLNREFIDTDAYIEKKWGSIKELFENGEDHFRNIEALAIKEISEKENVIIACGGGVIKREENITELKKKGTIFFIDRPLEDILNDIDISNRPLLSDGKDKLISIYNERYNLYIKSCDIHLKNASDLDNVIEEILYYK